MDELLDFGLHPPVAKLHLAELVGAHQGPTSSRLQPVVPQRAPARLGRVVELGVLLGLVFPRGDGVTYNVDGVCRGEQRSSPCSAQRGDAGRWEPPSSRKKGESRTKIRGGTQQITPTSRVSNTASSKHYNIKGTLGCTRTRPLGCTRGCERRGGRRGGNGACEEPGLTHIRAVGRRFGSWESGPGDPGGRRGWC